MARDDERNRTDEKDISDYEGGYGGGRERVERWPEHGFGDRGWGGGRGQEAARKPPEEDEQRRLPEGAHPTHGPDWQERYTRENRDKYGQWGGQPIAQRGSSGSMGGYQDREQGLGNTDEISPRGAYGIRETEHWSEQSRGGGNYIGRGPKNYKRCDDRVCEDVCLRLADDPDLDASEIEVEVKDGEVTLSGTVEDRRAKRLAEDLIVDVSGVSDVHNRIRIQPRHDEGMSTTGPAGKR